MLCTTSKCFGDVKFCLHIILVKTTPLLKQYTSLLSSKNY